jgi:hypothetical protein
MKLLKRACNRGVFASYGSCADTSHEQHIGPTLTCCSLATVVTSAVVIVAIIAGLFLARCALTMGLVRVFTYDNCFTGSYKAATTTEHSYVS